LAWNFKTYHEKASAPEKPAGVPHPATIGPGPAARKQQGNTGLFGHGHSAQGRTPLWRSFDAGGF